MPVSNSSPSNISRILTVAKKHFVFFLIGIITMLLAGLLVIPPSAVIKTLTDALHTGKSFFENIPVNIIPQQLINYGLPEFIINLNISSMSKYLPVFLLVFFMLEGLFRFVYTMSTRYFSILIGRDFRHQLFHKLIYLPLKTNKSRDSGDLTACILNNVGVLENQLSDFLITLIKDSVYCLVFIVILLVINLKLSFYFLVCLPVFFGLASLILKKIKKLAHRGQNKNADFLSLVQESVIGADIIHLHNAYNIVFDKFQSLYREIIKINIKSRAIEASISPFLGLVGSIIIGVIAISIGFGEVLKNNLTIGDFLSFLGVTLMLYQPLKRLLRLPGIYHGIIGSTERIFTLLDYDSEDQAGQDISSIQDISINTLSFKYNNSQDYILKNININIKQGQRIALVGQSGSGKSSLIKLIPLLYTPVEGEIQFNNINSSDINLNKLRDNISMLTQEAFVFKGSVRDNLLLAKPDATEEEMLKALEFAQVDFLEKNQELNTLLSERGNNLSGGQRQRLCIARAFLKNSNLLVLDEPTSALDTQSEQLVQASIDKLSQDKTVICVTHKLSLIENYDCIYCFRDGEITEFGTHRELLNQQGYYWQLLNN